MNDSCRINCPSSELLRSKRINLIVSEFNRWLSVDKISRLVDAFGGDAALLASCSPIEKVKWMKSFASVWDYRKRQASALTKEGESARWLLKNDEIVARNEELIYTAARELGLIGTKQSVYNHADYVLPLGGARLSNLRRCQLARDTVDCIRGNTTVVALSGMRPISESERVGYVDTYAPEAVTEFDAISAGMRIAFDLNEAYADEIIHSSNPNFQATIRHFDEKYRGTELYAVAAPSTVATRRANSADCFTYFFEKFEVPPRAKIVNCTSQIYCTYQQVRALSFAIKYDVEFDTIGFPVFQNNASSSACNRQLSEPVNYLQEIKGTIDAMNDFIDEFCQ